MAKDPAFLFYPGDYLKDTQCLSESAQVAYDRIMCEHMRNICITQERLNFFTKRLNEEQKSEVMHVLTKVPGGFQIEWVADSILKRRNYSDSRRKNRVGKHKDLPKDMLTHDSHMVNGDESVNEIENDFKFNKEEFDNQFLDDWTAWGKLIVDGNDQFWEAMKGRKVSQAEVDAFLSVGIRNSWIMDTQQKFRLTLKGFDFMKFNTNGNGNGKKEESTVYKPGRRLGEGE